MGVSVAVDSSDRVVKLIPYELELSLGAPRKRPPEEEVKRPHPLALMFLARAQRRELRHRIKRG